VVSFFHTFPAGNPPTRLIFNELSGEAPLYGFFMSIENVGRLHDEIEEVAARANAAYSRGSGRQHLEA
jgi:hypothetical protein